MAESDPDLEDFLDKVPSVKRRRDAERLLEIMRRATGESPRLQGSIIGFGTYHYTYESGREGDAAPVSFAPRKAATTIYLLDGIGRYPEHLARLGPHTTGVGCLYIKDLETVDTDVLEDIIAESYRTLTQGTYALRAREGRPSAAD